MANDVKIAILLSTYNSAKFLKVQIDSILTQTNTDWILYIRDDGSTDDTLEVISSYLKRGNIFLLKDSNKNIGAMKSFMFLLSQVKADYYMFCDHDDLWLPDKVELAKSEIIKMEMLWNKKPIIVHTDLIVVNNNLKVISNSFWRSSKLIPDVIATKNLIQVFNCVTGCTMIFNNEAKKVSFPFPESTPMHDWWITIRVLQENGKIKHIKEPTILYRQHDKNVVGAKNIDYSYFKSKLKNLWSTFEGHKSQIYFLKMIKGLTPFQYYYYKIKYTIQRNLQ